MDPVLTLRLDGITKAQTRARFALFISTIGSATILAGLWNEYFSWERQWAFEPKPSAWGQEELIKAQIDAWVDSQMVGVSLFGLSLSVSDIGLLGSITLCILSFWYCICMRRENHEIGTLLADIKNNERSQREYAYFGIRSQMVFMSTMENNEAISTLESTPAVPKPTVQSGYVFKMLNYLPCITIAIVALSDFYYCLIYVSPWRRNVGPVWFSLTWDYKVQIVLMLFCAIVFGIINFRYCRQADRYSKATQEVANAFGELLYSDFANLHTSKEGVNQATTVIADNPPHST